MNKPDTEILNTVYDALYRRYGPQHWWPAETPFEVMVGAVLTQSAAWTNVEKAISNLKAAGVLSPSALRDMEVERLATLIYPSGYFNAKAAKLKALVGWYRSGYGDELYKLKSGTIDELREELLRVHGIGEETADSILLYAVGKPSFVVDAYTRRIFQRLGVVPQKDSYSQWRELFMKALEPDVSKFSEYHALLVRHGKETCSKRSPACASCCLRDMCLVGRES